MDRISEFSNADTLAVDNEAVSIKEPESTVDPTVATVDNEVTFMILPLDGEFIEDSIIGGFAVTADISTDSIVDGVGTGEAVCEVVVVVVVAVEVSPTATV